MARARRAGKLRLPVPGAGLAYYYLLMSWATVVALGRYLRQGAPLMWEKAEGLANYRTKCCAFVGARLRGLLLCAPPGGQSARPVAAARRRGRLRHEQAGGAAADTPAPAELRPPAIPSASRTCACSCSTETSARRCAARSSASSAARADQPHRRGARILLPHRGRLLVTVAKRGYDAYSQRLNFVNRPLHGVRVYQQKLQWTMYGATPQRTQAHPYIRVRPPFKTIWSRAAGALLEFPAVVDDGVAFVTNYKGSVRAYLMNNGATVWRRDIGGMMAASPAVYGDAARSCTGWTAPCGC